MSRTERLLRKRERLVVQIAALDFAIARIDGDAQRIAAASVALRKAYEAVTCPVIIKSDGSALKRALYKVRKQQQELIRTCRTYQANWPDNSRTAWRMLLRDLRSGKWFSFCGCGDAPHGTWRDLYAAEYPRHSIPERCPTVWVHRFLSYQSFLRMARGAVPVVGPIKLHMNNGSTITAAAPSADTVRGMPS